MSRRINLSLALILGLAFALNSAPLLAIQEQELGPCDPNVLEEGVTFFQDCTSRGTDPGTHAFGFGLEITGGPAGESEGAERLYGVRFIGEPGNETGAYVPERFNSEAMVVNVLSGNFAFRTQGEGVIVDAQGPVLETYIATPGIGLGIDPNVEGGRVFDDGGSEEQINCDLNLHGQELCQLEPEEFAEGSKFVRLDPGDTVYLPDNSTCFLCNTVRIDATPAELLIWSSITGFNGDLEDVANAMESSQQSTPVAQGPSRVLGWMLNPGARCN